MKATPSPAITACLIVSLESISVPGSSSRPGMSPRNRSNEIRVPDPALADDEMLARHLLLGHIAPPGERMVGRGDDRPADGRRTRPRAPECRAAAVPSARCRSGDPSDWRSSRRGCRRRASCRRPGYSRMKPAISRGAKYFAVETTPTMRLPLRTPLMASISSPRIAQPLLDRLRRVDDGEARGSRTHAIARCGRTARRPPPPPAA